MPYKIVALELKDVVPRRAPDQPNFYVGIVDSNLETLDEFVAASPPWIIGQVKVVRDDLVPKSHFQTKARARKKRALAIKKLTAQGYTVNRDRTLYRLYVIELNPEGKSDPGKGYVYVGETSKPVEERYQQHISDAKDRKGRRIASRVVVKRGLGLRSDLAPRQVYFSRKASREAEARLAERLRERGYTVEGGH